MPNRGAEGIIMGEVKGLYDRSPFHDSIPPDHLAIANNISYGEDGWRTRPGCRAYLNLFGVGNVRRFYHYNRLNEVARLIILTESGQLYDSTDMLRPIHNGGAKWKDFSAAQYYNNIFITPHDRNTGIEGEFVYIYDGTTFRKAGGSVPSGQLTAAASNQSGHVEAGTHIYAVAYETASGYLTKPGPAIYPVLASDGTRKVDISNIPIGPPGTIARRLLTTRRIPTTGVGAYNGNQDGYEFFFIPTGRLADNTTTSVTLDFYDADLLLSADYLFDLLADIPAGVGLTTYQKSLVVWGEFNDPSTVRLSRQGEPETFDAVEGLMTVAPNESGGVKNCVEFRDLLYMMKSYRTYAVSRDLTNDESPIFWRIISIDEGIGTECFGIASILDVQGPNTDSFIVAAFSGIYRFNGIYAQPEFSWKIDNFWHQINRSRFDEIQIYNDIVANLIYIFLPDSTVLVADYRNGLDFQSIRWARWTFPWVITSISINVQPDKVEHLLIAGDNVIWQFDPEEINDGDIAIHTKVEYAPQTAQPDGTIFTFKSMKLRGMGNGLLKVKMRGLDDRTTFNVRPINLEMNPGKEYQRQANLVNERCSIEMEMTEADDFVLVQRVTVFPDATWTERPSDPAE